MSMGAAAIRAGQAFVEVFADSSRLAAGLRQAQAQIRQFAAGVQSTGLGMMKLGGAASLPLGNAARTFGEFERQMLRVKSIIQPTEADFNALREEALRIGRDTSFSASEAAQAMVMFAQAGFSVKETLAATGPTMLLAASNQMDLTQATGAAITVLRGMALDASELTRTLEILATVANASYTDVGLLASGFSYVAADARAAGLGVKEVAAFLGVLSDEGVRGERGGTTMRAILADLKNLTPQAAAELQRLGVVLWDAKANWRAPEAIFADLTAQWSKMGSAARGMSVSKIFDTRSGSGAEIFSRNIDKYLDLIQKGEKSKGQLNRMEGIQMSGFWGAMKIFTSSLEGLDIAAGKALADTMKEMSDTAVTLVNRFSKWAEKNPELISTVGKLAAGLLIGGTALVALSAGISVLAPLLGAMAFAFKAVLAVELAQWLGGMASKVKTLRGAWDSMAAGGKRALGDLGSALMGVAAQVSMAAKRIWGDMHTMGAGIGDALAVGDWEGAWKVTTLGLQIIWVELWDQLRGAALTAVDTIGSMMLQTFVGVFAGILKLNMALIKEIGQGWEMIKDKWSIGSGMGLNFEEDRKRAMAKAAEWDKWESKTNREIDKTAASIGAAISSNMTTARMENYKGAGAGARDKRNELETLGTDLGIARFIADMDGMIEAMNADMAKMGGAAKTAAMAAGEGGMTGNGSSATNTFFGYLAGQMTASSVNEQIQQNTRRAADALDKIAVGAAAGIAFR